MAEALGRPPILALTATASPLIREEIVPGSGSASPPSSPAASTGPISSSPSNAMKTPVPSVARCVTATSDAEPPGIVYTATRRAAEEVAAS